jgi:hypothetical protein
MKMAFSFLIRGRPLFEVTAASVSRKKRHKNGAWLSLDDRLNNLEGGRCNEAQFVRAPVFLLKDQVANVLQRLLSGDPLISKKMKIGLNSHTSIEN